ncbi:hypothetical protein V6Z12_D02G049600 [Gossypium hirsutum]
MECTVVRFMKNVGNDPNKINPLVPVDLGDAMFHCYSISMLIMIL